MQFPVRYAALWLWALPTPQTISAVGLENLSCLVCKLQITWILLFQILESEAGSKSCRRSKWRFPFPLVYHAGAHNCVSNQELLVRYEHIVQSHRNKCPLGSILSYKPCHISQMKCSIRRVTTEGPTYLTLKCSMDHVMHAANILSFLHMETWKAMLSSRSAWFCWFTSHRSTNRAQLSWMFS